MKILLKLFLVLHLFSGRFIFSGPVDSLASAFSSIKKVTIEDGEDFKVFKKELEEIEKKPNKDFKPDDAQKLNKLFVKENEKHLLQWIDQADKSLLFKVVDASRENANYVVLAAEKDLMSIAQKLLEKVPEVVTKKTGFPSERNVLIDLMILYKDSEIDYPNMLDSVVQHNKALLDFMLQIVDKSQQEDLIKLGEYSRPLLASALMNGNDALVCAIMKKFPEIARISSKKDANRNVFSEMMQHYNTGLTDALKNGFKITEMQVKHWRDAIICIFEGSYVYDINNFEDQQRIELVLLYFAILDSMQNIPKIFYDSGNELSLQSLKGGILDIYKTFIKKFPDIFQDNFFDLLDQYVGLKKDSDEERTLKPFMQHAIAEYQKKFKNQKIKIGEKSDALIKKGLKAGQEYTLDHILNAVGYN